MIPYIKLTIAASLPVLATAVLFTAEKKTQFGALSTRTRQVLYGLIFGLIAVMGTEWGIPINGAQVNCRDAAVLIAGLLFGGPAGIIAGLIGGVERWVAVAWGVGSFTRLACSVSTILAGFFAALVRKYLFEGKRPGWLIAFMAGVVMEVFHLTMVFVTNIATPAEAMAVVEACSFPMILSNGLSVLLATMAMTLLEEPQSKQTERQVSISQTIQKWLMITVVLALVVTFSFVFNLQNTLATAQEDQLLTLALNETEADIRDASNRNLLRLAYDVVEDMETFSLDWIAYKNDLAEINVVDEQGVIVNSTTPDFIGYRMADGRQSAEFLCLLNGETEYAQEYGPISYDEDISRKYAGIKTEHGFVQVGYDAAQFQKDIDSDIIGITKNRHVGRTGYILIIDAQYQVVSAPEAISQKSLKEEVLATDLPGADQTFQAYLNGVLCCFRYRSAEGYHIIAVVPEAEVMQSRNIALYVNAFLQILLFAVLFGLIYLLIKRTVVDQVKKVTTSLNRITNGDLNEVVDVHSNEEFTNLSDDINQTVDTLKRYIGEAAARIDQELEMAKSIQVSALPNVFPAFPQRKEFEIYASMDPAKEVGGDFYDFYMTGTETLNFLIADVSGKGIPAAMFMMRAKTELKSLTESQMPIGDVFTNGNQALCEGNDAGMFVTVWQGQLNLKTGTVRFANAGHNPPILASGKEGFAVRKCKAGLVLAGMEDMVYQTQELQLSPGDTLFLYTDGVTEAQTAAMELYGEERLVNVLNAKNYGSMQELCKAVRADVDAFVGDAPQFDDITMVALRFNGLMGAPSIRFEAATLEDLAALQVFVTEQMNQLHCSEQITEPVHLAVDEVYHNIIQNIPAEQRGSVTAIFRVKEDPKRISIRFEAVGAAYNPLIQSDAEPSGAVVDPTLADLSHARKLMDNVKYQYADGKNILTIVKNLE